MLREAFSTSAGVSVLKSPCKMSVESSLSPAFDAKHTIAQHFLTPDAHSSHRNRQLLNDTRGGIRSLVFDLTITASADAFRIAKVTSKEHIACDSVINDAIRVLQEGGEME